MEMHFVTETHLGKKTLGKSGFQVSEIGLGCWQPGGDFGRVSDARPQDILAAADHVGIIVRLPLASGVLSGKMRHGQTFDESDHRNDNRRGEAFSQGETFSGIAFDTAVAPVQEMRAGLPDGMRAAPGRYGKTPVSAICRRWTRNCTAGCRSFTVPG
jgi:aryl-alcohol dehydrogenase-like predicted oxidoreductase